MEEKLSFEETVIFPNTVIPPDVSKEIQKPYDPVEMFEKMFLTKKLDAAKNANAWIGYGYSLANKELKVKELNKSISTSLEKKWHNTYSLKNSRLKAEKIELEISKYNPNRLLHNKKRRKLKKLKVKYTDELSHISRVERNIGENINDIRKLRLQKAMECGGALSQFNILPRATSTKGWQAALKDSSMNDAWKLMKEGGKALNSSNKVEKLSSIGRNIKASSISGLKKTGDLIKGGQDILTSSNKLQKLSAAVKNIPIKKTLTKLKPFGQLLGPLNAAANVHTIVRDDSHFKKLLAGADLVGDVTPLSPITSLLNTALPAVYDGLNKNNQRKLDKAARLAINFGKNVIKKASILPNLKALKNSKSMSEKLSAGIDIAAKLTPFGTAKSLVSGTLTTVYEELGEGNKKKINDFTAAVKGSIGKMIGGTASYLTKPLISRAMENRRHYYDKEALKEHIALKNRRKSINEGNEALKEHLSLKNRRRVFEVKPRLNKYNNASRQALKEHLSIKNRGLSRDSLSDAKPVGNSMGNNFTVSINGDSLQSIANKLASEINLKMKNICAM